MAIKTTVQGDGAVAARASTPGVATLGRPMLDLSAFALPTEKTKPITNLSAYLLFIYGEKKIGKTTFASRFPSALHCYFEPGGKGLSTYAMEVQYWEQFLKIVELLEGEEGDRFENLVIDTADIAWRAYSKWFCQGEFINHPSDNNDYGKTWEKLSNGWIETMHRVTHIGKGVILLSHAKESTIKTLNQGETTRMISTCPDRAASYIMGAADMNAYYGYYEEHRFLVIDGSSNIDAGHRMENNFLTPYGERIKAIPMGTTSQEAYDNFQIAFRNEQEETFEDIAAGKASLRDLSSVLKKPMEKKR